MIWRSWHESQSCEPLRRAGASIIVTDSDDPTEMVLIALRRMGKQSMTNLMLEGGSELLASFFECGQIDECQVFLGAKLVGGRQSPGPIGGAGIQQIAEAPGFSLVSVAALQDDLKAVYRRVGAESCDC